MRKEEAGIGYFESFSLFSSKAADVGSQPFLMLAFSLISTDFLILFSISIKESLHHKRKA